MKIVTIKKMPKSRFDNCHARKCSHLATNVVTLLSHYDGVLEDINYCFCDKHFEQFRREAAINKE
jgi:hypothetical protein